MIIIKSLNVILRKTFIETNLKQHNFARDPLSDNCHWLSVFDGMLSIMDDSFSLPSAPGLRLSIQLEAHLTGPETCGHLALTIIGRMGSVWVSPPKS